VQRGRYLGQVTQGVLALLPGDRAIFDESTDGGLALSTPGASKPARDGGGRPESVAVDAAGARVVSFEDKDSERRLVVRELPSLKRVRETSLGKGPSEGTAAFLADGREAAFTAYGCTEVACEGDKDASCRQEKCEDTGIVAVENGAPAPLVRGLRAAAFGARGDVAAVARKDGSIALVALPEGRALAELPGVDKDAEIQAMAVSPAGDRVAVAVEDKLAVYARQGEGAFVEVLADKRHFTRSLRFSADGRTLFAGDDLGVYREGAAPREQALPPYEVTLPRGFTRMERAADTFRLADGSKEIGAEPGSIAMFTASKAGTDVIIVARDPDEFDPSGDAEAWARRVAARLFPYAPLETAKDRKKAHFVAWGGEGEGRSFELRWTSSGCEDMDHYERVTERGGAVYHVHLEIMGTLSDKRVRPWLGAFFDAPLGQSPARAKAEAHHPKKHTRRKKK
jgi:hypothetical protein